MRRKVTKAAALLSAVLMASSSVPYGVLIPYNVLAEEVSADAGAAVQEETAATVGSVTNIKTWDAAGLLAAATTEDSGLSLKGDGWTTGTDTAGAEAFGTGDYVKAGGVKPTPNNGAIPTAGCYLQYTATDSGKLTIMEKTQKSNKSFYVVDSDGVVKDTKTSGSASTYDTITIDVEEGKTYYAYMSGSTANIFQVVYTPTQVVRTWDAASLLAAATTEDNGVSLKGDGWTSGTDTAGAEAFGTGDYVKAGGVKPTPNNGAVPTAGCYLQYTATENGKLTIMEKTQKSNKSFYVVDSDGVVKATKTSGSASTYDTITVDVEEGKTYYAYMSGSTANIFSVSLAVGEKKQTAWADVAAPVINSVTTDEAGDFVVDFSAVIDAYKGADDVKVTMLQDGLEVSTQTFTKQADTATFAPYRSGTYTFVVVAQRYGEADKASEVYTYKDYVLAVKKPVITWAQNKGNGDVYLDWINIEDADSYSVAYKESGSTADYTVVESALSAETGNYTLTGLTAGKSYDIQIKALRKSDGFESVYTEKDFEVTTAEEQPWYAAIVGSAQAGDVTFTTADGQTDNVKLSVSDNSATKSNNQESPAIAGTAGTLEVKGQASGKISDDEDGFTYYYTKIDPNKENFKLSATFEITDTSLTPDNQTGFGIVAADALGLNVWGNPDYVHKYFNYASSMMFSSKQSNPFMRTVTGYTSADTSSNDGVERSVTNARFTDQTAKFEVGNKYTFSLEKTDEGYTAACNGSEQKLSDNSFTSVQEDGTVVVGIAVSRKVSVKVSDVAFSKSESKGITSNDNGDTKITPDGRVYSTSTSGSANYEYIYVPNCAGTLTVSNGDTDVVVDQAVAANEVVRVNVPLNNGKNTVKSTLKPTAADNIASTVAVIKETVVDHQSYGQEGQTIIVSADADAEGKGTEESPMSLSNALKYAQPGQTIFLKNGTYSGAKVERSVSGTADKNINLVAESLSTDGTDGVVFTGEVRLTGSYWHVYGLYVKDSAGVGIQICGNYNTIEMCTVNHAANSGIQISREGGADNDAGRKGKLWPTGNLIKNCESFDNCDAGRNDADGFAAKLTCGEDNKFYGCISHNNIDDGWDLYAKSVSGEIGAVTIENCVTYNNGWLTTDDVTAKGYEYGEGNGFKLGGGQMKGAHVLKNSISFDNHAKGITSNSCPDCKIINCISYNNSLDNSAYNVGLNTKDSNIKAWEVTGLISLNNSKNTTLEDLIPFALHSENNYIYDGAASYNNKGEQATEDWFENVDTSVKPTRNEDGTINMHGLLLLKDTSKNTGAVLDVTSDAAKSVKPAKTEVIDGTTTPETKKDGVVVDENGNIHYYVNGVEVTDYTGLAVNAETGKKYWFDNGVAARSKEAYDSEADAWYWFDADGTMAIDKDVNIPDGTENGKWVRYDENGKMKKGEDYRYGGWYHFDETTGAMTKGFTNIADGTEEGKWVYYDEITGQMHHGDSVINGNSYHFDDITGKMVHGAYTAEDGTPCYYDEITGIGLDCQWQLDGDEAFWYEGGKRQGLEGRGKEIYDPATDAWYWLDSVDGGKRAMSKDVYQESDGGKWVRYDEEGHMVKGWNELNGAKYYFDPITGAMRKGTLQIDGVQYTFDETTGILIQ
mgnify:FL=1|jgi:glucan-binding YG repeat protein